MADLAIAMGHVKARPANLLLRCYPHVAAFTPARWTRLR
jgi:hypothetical protein